MRFSLSYALSDGKIVNSISDNSSNVVFSLLALVKKLCKYFPVILWLQFLTVCWLSKHKAFCHQPIPILIFHDRFSTRWCIFDKQLINYYELCNDAVICKLIFVDNIAGLLNFSLLMLDLFAFVLRSEKITVSDIGTRLN